MEFHFFWILGKKIGGVVLNSRKLMFNILKEVLYSHGFVT